LMTSLGDVGVSTSPTPLTPVTSSSKRRWLRSAIPRRRRWQKTRAPDLLVEECARNGPDLHGEEKEDDDRGHEACTAACDEALARASAPENEIEACASGDEALARALAQEDEFEAASSDEFLARSFQEDAAEACTFSDEVLARASMYKDLDGIDKDLEERAIQQYAKFHGLMAQDVTLGHVRSSCAGLAGWAAPFSQTRIVTLHVLQSECGFFEVSCISIAGTLLAKLKLDLQDNLRKVQVLLAEKVNASPWEFVIVLPDGTLLTEAYLDMGMRSFV